MMNVELSDKILCVLSRFSHGLRTNFKKRKLTNHDACAYVFYMAGKCQLQDVVDILRKWRGNETMTFGYLFNKSQFGGYGFVGSTYSCVGQIMNVEFRNPGRIWGRVETGEMYKPGPNYILPEDDNTLSTYVEFIRRTYWERSSHGMYSPTIGCARRIEELKEFFA